MGKKTTTKLNAMSMSSWGFLPQIDKLALIPHGLLAELASAMPRLRAQNSLHAEIDQLNINIDLLDGIDQNDVRAIAGARLVLTMLAAAYVFQDPQKPSNELPAVLAKPLLHIAAIQDCPPSLTYTDYILNNWHLINEDEGISLHNIQPHFTFTGTADEAWFIKIHVMIEYTLGPAMKDLCKAVDLAAQPPVATDKLESIHRTVSPSSENFIGMKSGKGLKNEFQVKSVLKRHIPDTLFLGSAVDDGDCFFDALTQIINEMNGTDVNSTKYLRSLCHDFYSKNKSLVDEWNKSDFGGIDSRIDDYYMVQYTFQECQEHFNGRAPIWGRPHIEGRILCAKLNLNAICLIEILKDPDTQQPIIGYYLITYEHGSKAIDESKAENFIKQPSIPTLVVERGELHFVPVLRTKSSHKLTSLLVNIEKCLRAATALLARMREHCKPETFFSIIRSNMMGFENVKSIIDGEEIAGVKFAGSDQYIDTHGASGAQSGLLHAIDDALGVKHKQNKMQAMLSDMVAYMPQGHQHFIAQMKNSKLKERAESDAAARPDLFAAYNNIITALSEFRHTHRTDVVVRYLNPPGKKKIATESESAGTGGSKKPSVLLLQSEQETNASKLVTLINMWTTNSGEGSVAVGNQVSQVSLTGTPANIQL